MGKPSEHFEARVQAMFDKYLPTSGHKVRDAVATYGGNREEAFIQALVMRFGAEPPSWERRALRKQSLITLKAIAAQPTMQELEAQRRVKDVQLQETAARKQIVADLRKAKEDLLGKYSARVRAMLQTEAVRLLAQHLETERAKAQEFLASQEQKKRATASLREIQNLLVKAQDTELSTRMTHIEAERAERKAIMSELQDAARADAAATAKVKRGKSTDRLLSRTASLARRADCSSPNLRRGRSESRVERGAADKKPSMVSNPGPGSPPGRTSFVARHRASISASVAEPVSSGGSPGNSPVNDGDRHSLLSESLLISPKNGLSLSADVGIISPKSAGTQDGLLTSPSQRKPATLPTIDPRQSGASPHMLIPTGLTTP